MEPTPHYPSLAEIRACRRDERVARIRRVLMAMDALARAEGGRLLVFGSLAEGGFDERSDVDVAVFGLAPGPDERLAIEIDVALEAEGFHPDVLTERWLGPSLKQRILEFGQEPDALG